MQEIDCCLQSVFEREDEADSKMCNPVQFNTVNSILKKKMKHNFFKVKKATLENFHLGNHKYGQTAGIPMHKQCYCSYLFFSN